MGKLDSHVAKSRVVSFQSWVLLHLFCGHLEQLRFIKNDMKRKEELLNLLYSYFPIDDEFGNLDSEQPRVEEFCCNVKGVTFLWQVPEYVFRLWTWIYKNTSCKNAYRLIAENLGAAVHIYMLHIVCTYIYIYIYIWIKWLK